MNVPSPEAQPMKWYFAINESGSQDHTGFHAKLAVLSAQRNTSLIPHMLYSGHRNEFTQWMEARGVAIVDAHLPFEDLILALDAKGLYSKIFIGHWLRTTICQIEQRDQYVLYTDCDVVFLRQPDLASEHPPLFACAPEFRVDEWNYFNSGVMLIDTIGLRQDYAAFIGFIRQKISEMGHHFLDQYAYNLFYRGRWSRLSPLLNWKAYWDINPSAAILHFHGPKMGAINALIAGHWNWADPNGMQVGSLLAGHVGHYAHWVQATIDAIGADATAERAPLEQTLHLLAGFTPPKELDLSVLDFRLFGD